MGEKRGWQDYQNARGLFPAAIASENQLMQELFWIRDNYYIWLSLDGERKELMTRGFQSLFDVHKEKISIHTAKKPREEWEYIHPLYKLEDNFYEINHNVPLEKQIGWPWVQNDSIGNLLEILSFTEDFQRASLLVDYLRTIEYYSCPDSGFWERGKELRSSSIAACIRGLQAFQEKFSYDQQNLIEQGYKTLRGIFPKETPTRNEDLALLSLIYPGKLDEHYLPEGFKEKVISQVQPLIGERGLKRYLGDEWAGKEGIFLNEGEEMEWTLGLPWMYLATREEKYFMKAKEIKEKLEYLPEGFVRGEPNCTRCLFMSEAFYSLAEKAFHENSVAVSA